MKTFFKRISVLLSLGATFMIFGGPSGSCGASLASALLDSGGYSYGDDSSSHQSDTNDKLIVSGSGEFINIEYNHLTFPSRLNFDSGLYYFAPDPEGKITGDKIICATMITPDNVEGDCFRQGHVCHFDYWNDPSSSTDTKDAYFLGTTSCRQGADVGPFLVPLESPMCGQDPFPTCPTDDLFPSGPPPATTPPVTTPPAPTDTGTPTPAPETQPTQ